MRRNEIPHEKVGERATFRRIEIDAWASQRLLGMRGEEVQDFHENSTARHHDLSNQHALIPELMKPEYIDHHLAVKTRNAAIRGMVDLANRTSLVIYPEDLLSGVDEREKMGSTALPGGLALMHPPHHDPYMFEDTFIVLGRAPSPIPFGSPDGRLTDLFFLVCSQDDKIHLHLLARLSMMCFHTPLLLDLHEAMDREAMYEVLVASEAEVIAKNARKKNKRS